MDDPERRVGAVVVEAEGGLAVDVRAAEAERVRLEQRWRTFERGRFEPEDAHAKGNLWIAGGSIASLVPLFLAVPDEDTGERVLEPGTALLSSFVVLNIIGLVGTAQHLSPYVLPPAVRNTKRSVRTSISTRSPTPLVDYAVDVRTNGRVLAAGRTGPNGGALLPIGVPDAWELIVRDENAKAVAWIDLRTTQAWLIARRARARILVGEGRFDEARAAITEIAGHDVRAWDAYCGAVTDGWSSLDLPGRTAALAGAPFSLGACGEAWDTLDSAWASALLPAASEGPVPAWADAAAAAAALPVGRRDRVDGLAACVSARGDADEEAAYGRLEPMLASADDTTRSCADTARAELAPAYRRAVAAREWAERAEEAARARAEREEAAAEAREEAAVAARYRAEAASWPGRIEGVLSTCRWFQAEVSRRRSAVMALAARYDSRAEGAAESFSAWIEEQGEGKMGAALETLRSVMEEMETHEEMGDDTRLRRQRLAIDAERYCAG